MRYCLWSYFLDRLVDESPQHARSQARRKYHLLVKRQSVAEVELDESMLVADALFHKAVDHLCRADISKEMSKLAEYGEQKGQACTLWRYIAVVAKEGKLFGDSFILLLAPHEAMRPRAWRFCRWLRLLMVGVALKDSGHDLFEDRKNFRIAIHPTKKKQALLLLVSVAVLVWASLQAPITSMRMALWYLQNSGSRTL